MDFTNEINTLESEKLRLEADEHLMYTVRGVFRLLNIDSEWTK